MYIIHSIVYVYIGIYIYLKREYIESVLLCSPLKKYSNSVIDDPNINKSP